MKLPKCSLGFLLLALVFVCIGQLFSPKETIILSKIHLSPSFSHPFGTDDLGRDLFLLCCNGLKTSLTIGLIAAFFDLFIGVPYGALAGFYEGSLSVAMLRLADILHIIPLILQILLFMSIFGSGLFPIVLSLFLSSWTTMARVVSSQARILRSKPFVLYANMMGASYLHIFSTHLLKNLWTFITPILTYTIPKAVFTEAFLSFLGMGISPPASSLGMLIAQGMATMEFFPWRLFFPSLLLFAVLLSLHNVGNFLQRDAPL
ncbi:MAG: ABC transporter permease [Chlamydiota bacterium]